MRAAVRPSVCCCFLFRLAPSELSSPCYRKVCERVHAAVKDLQWVWQRAFLFIIRGACSLFCVNQVSVCLCVCLYMRWIVDAGRFLFVLSMKIQWQETRAPTDENKKLHCVKNITRLNYRPCLFFLLTALGHFKKNVNAPICINRGKFWSRKRLNRIMPMDNKQNFDCIVMLFFNEMVIFFNFTSSALINFQYTAIEHEEYPILCALPHAGWKKWNTCSPSYMLDAHHCWSHVKSEMLSMPVCARGLFWRKRAPHLPRAHKHTQWAYTYLDLAKEKRQGQIFSSTIHVLASAG